MVIDISINVSRERLHASIPASGRAIVEPNEVVLRSTRRGPQVVAVGRIGRPAELAADMSLEPAYDPDAFEAQLSASVIHYLRMALWQAHRGSSPLMMLDRLRVSLTLPDYHKIPADRRAQFERELAALSNRRHRLLINGAPPAAGRSDATRSWWRRALHG